MIDGWTWAALASKYRLFFDSLLRDRGPAEGACCR